MILAGGIGSQPFGLADGASPMSYPMADGRPLLTHILHSLKANGIRDVAVSSSRPLNGRTTELPIEHLDGLRVVGATDDGFKGAAGALASVREFLAGSPFLVIGAPLWLDGTDLGPIWESHRRRGAAGTVVGEGRSPEPHALENIVFKSCGAVRECNALHRSRERRKAMRPVGLYLFEPSVLDLIDPDGYTDIREQLIPAITERGMPVHAYAMGNPPPQVSGFEAYRHVNRAILMHQLPANGSNGGRTRPGVRIGRNSVVSPDAYVLGPVIIGNDCNVAPGAQIIGPALISDGVHVASGALVRESFVWRGARLGSDCSVSYSVVAESCEIPADKCLDNALIVDGDKSVSLERGPTVAPHATVWRNGANGRLKRWSRPRLGYRKCKRAIDLVASALGLLFCAPLFAVIALAIKLDSPGPVHFVQRRCGRHGKEFPMVKFRTMYTDAEARKAELAHRNEAEGPMYKIAADPRITPVGRFLRKTSLDELPQLWNVLRGEMSLVGPRPLVMQEMTWSPRWRDIRLEVKPGITGPWQVYARNEPGFRSWIEHDIDYVRNRSLGMDLRLLARTAGTLVGKAGGV